MKFRFYLLSLTIALLVSACTNTRYAANGEYDDVYFTSADRSAEVASADLEGPEVYGTNEDKERYSSNTSRRDYRVNSYRDEVYDEDDFYFSRRLRRFGSASSSAWRYYDPYYSNDLYYVMGTPAWSSWRNNGWYSWNRPRFGSSLNWTYFNDPFYSGIYDTWGMNYGNYYNYYNPWVSTYYGVNPAFGYSPFGFGNRFGGFNGFGGGFGFGNFGYGSAFYCPPYAYTAGAAGVASSRGRNWNRYYTARRQSSTSSVRTNTGYGTGSRTRPATNDPRRTAARPAGYTSTRAERVSNSGMYLAPKGRTQTISNSSRVSRTNPNSSTSRPTATRPSNRTSPRVYTRPNNNSTSRTNSNINRRSNTRTNSTYNRPGNTNRTYTRPNNRTTTRPNNRTYSRPSNSSRTRTYSRPSSGSRPSSTYSRPSSSRPSSARPSSSRPSSSRPSSTRPSSSSRRPSGSRSSSSSSSSRVRP